VRPADPRELTPVPEVLLSTSPEDPALGRDPFEEPLGPDPLASRLDVLERGPRGGRNLPRAAAPVAPVKPAARPAARRGSSRRRAQVPALSEIDLPRPSGWLDRLLGEDSRRVLAALSHLVEGEGPYDRFGFSPDATKAAFPIFHALYRGYFRAKSVGQEHIPVSGPAVLVSNHAGLLPFDAAMTVVDVALHTDPPRLARAVVDRWAGTLPWVNVFYARVGQIIGTRENFSDLLDDGQVVLVYPEGMAGVRKTIAHSSRSGWASSSTRSAPAHPSCRWR
jgi:hypothetical protein